MFKGSKRIPIIAANWKMYKTRAEAQEFFRTLKPPVGVKVFISPPFTALATAAEVAGSIMVGAQNMHEAEEGAFTGEISAPMI